MKVVCIKARAESPNLKVGTEYEIKEEQFAPLFKEGIVVTATEYELSQNKIKAVAASVDAEIKAAIEREAVLPKDDKVQAQWKEEALAMESVKPGLGVEYIRAKRGKEHAELEKRFTTRVDEDGNVIKGRGVEYVRADVREAGSAYLKTYRDQRAVLKAGGATSLKDAIKLSQEAAIIYASEIRPLILKGHDFREQDVIKASDNVDPNVGTLATGIVLMRNLGFLKYKLNFMQYISTDLRNEPVAFGQNVLTRYITPPAVTTFVPGVGMTTDATTSANWKATITATNPAGTVQTGTQTRSTPSTTDKNVVINNYKGVDITFSELTLGGTLRNLFAEQQGAMFYSLAQQVNQDFITNAYTSVWTPAAKAAFSVAGGADPSFGPGQQSPFGLANIIALKNQFTLNKMPDVGRFVLLHSIYHDAILTDSNLLNAKAILALLNKDASSFESGELPTLFGVKVLESQLASTNSAGALVSLTSAQGVQAAVGNGGFIGMAGDSASMLFAARIPQDYTKVMPEIPATASLEIVTEPDSGLSILLIKRVDHNLQAAYATTGLMYGFGQGDPRQGFLLQP